MLTGTDLSEYQRMFIAHLSIRTRTAVGSWHAWVSRAGKSTPANMRADGRVNMQHKHNFNLMKKMLTLINFLVFEPKNIPLWVQQGPLYRSCSSCTLLFNLLPHPQHHIHKSYHLYRFEQRGLFAVLLQIRKARKCYGKSESVIGHLCDQISARARTPGS